MNGFRPNEKIEGWMSGEELEWLAGLAEKMEMIVEVGAWKGRTTHAICSGCKGNVIAVDHFLGSWNERDTTHAEAKKVDISELFWKNVGHFKNISVMKMDSSLAASLFAPKSVDMVFIDACHLYEDFKRDLESWLPKCRRWIGGHDKDDEGVRRAITERFGVVSEFHACWFVELDK